ncbi:PREDICTED: transcription factor bHLH25-like [Camelina sativa]|uniref:Transcription factor bHLH25-like n=1 Tax=Camelina sativa TaxID=90675 RepID=A0ABM1QRW1_CAMSA|nr:PREDICTED: transcription factor bHLH25-like [Camelina sativa]
MNMLSARWFSEQEIEENSIIQQFHMKSIVGEVHEAQYTLPNSFHTNINPSYDDDLIEMKPSKILKTTYILPQLPPPHSSSLPPNSKPHLHCQPSSRILSFGNAGSNVMDHDYSPNSIFSPKVEATTRKQAVWDSKNRPKMVANALYMTIL